jgi:N-acetyl-anhydromuramyl-L-alanine amidase AmpD
VRALLRRFSPRIRFMVSLLGLLALLTGCTTTPLPGTFAARHDDEIVIAGQFVHTGTPVVLWMDPGGYDAYRVERRFSAFDASSWATSQLAVASLTTPNRYGLRRGTLTLAEIERVRGGGWDLALLQKVVDQFVYHYDASGTSRECFRVLHDVRDLSVHFLLDLDGTIYQTLDVKERAWHATVANTRSIGIEIANIGAFPVGQGNPFADWYAKTSNGPPRLTVPTRLEPSGFHTQSFVGHPARSQPVTAAIQGQELVQYDFTPEQYRALIKLTATLCRVFPKLKCDYPRDASGQLLTRQLSTEQLDRYQGLLGHFHVQSNKVDPGPAFQWDSVIDGARRLLAESDESGFVRPTLGRSSVR